jgi:uncharacterized protein YndB with AHSA1/START domain
MRHPIVLSLAPALAFAPLPAAAEVVSSTASGFVSRNEVLVAVPAAEVWTAMLRPAGWWNGDHTYSGNPANLTIVPSAGGCFCEVIPATDSASEGQIEHMRVIYVAPGATLRLTGGLGPLQSEAVTGVLTMTLAPDGDMTRIRWDYVVGGFMRLETAEIGPLVDQVVGEQLLRLATSLGAKVDPAPRRGGAGGF